MKQKHFFILLAAILLLGSGAQAQEAAKAQDAPAAKAILLWRTITFPAAVSVFAYAPDEKTFAAASGNQAYIYNENLEVIGTLRGHQGTIDALTFTPDGKLVVTGGSDATIRLWNAADGAAIKTLTGHVRGINQFAFSPDGKLMASASDDTAIGIWDMEKQELSKALQGSYSSVGSVVFTPDGKSLKSVAWGRKNDQPVTELRIWDLATGAPTFEQALALPCTQGALSSDGALFVRGLEKQRMEVHDANSGEQLRTLRLTPNNVKTYQRPDDGVLIKEFVHELTTVTPLAFVPGTHIVAIMTSNVLRLWDADSGEYLQRHPLNVSKLLAISPSGRMLATTGETVITDADGFKRKVQGLHLWKVQ